MLRFAQHLQKHSIKSWGGGNPSKRLIHSPFVRICGLDSTYQDMLPLKNKRGHNPTSILGKASIWRAVPHKHPFLQRSVFGFPVSMDLDMRFLFSLAARCMALELKHEDR